MTTKVLYHINSCDACQDDDTYDRVGEGDFFLSEDCLTVVEFWSNNDARWRPEYMSGLISQFGGSVKSAWDLSPVMKQVADATINDYIEANF